VYLFIRDAAGTTSAMPGNASTVLEAKSGLLVPVAAITNKTPAALTVTANANEM
jgi:hypothetical protein